MYCVFWTLCMLGNFACFFVICGCIFFKLAFSKKKKKKKNSGIPSEFQTVWIKIRTDVLSGLIWVQTVCKGYQQTTIVATSGESVKYLDSLTPYHICSRIWTHPFCYLLIFLQIVGWMAKVADPDHMAFLWCLIWFYIIWLGLNMVSMFFLLFFCFVLFLL